MSGREPPPPIIGVSLAIRRARDLISRYSPTSLSILLHGATGTGKELFAEHIHHLSGRRGALVDVNCAALPRDMAESLLFGHERGAFTGAVQATRGYIRRADGGTLFLDEIDSLPLEVQGKLLRVIEKQEVGSLDADERRRVNVRFIAAGSDRIGRALGTGELRQDLYQRLAGVVIELTPLRARPEDLLPLARYFAELQGQSLENGAELILQNYGWPGNVREVRLAIERARHLVPNGCLSAAALAEAISLGRAFSGPGAGRVASLASMTREELLSMLEANGWHAGRTAQALRVGRTKLFATLRAKEISLRGRKPLADNAEFIL